MRSSGLSPASSAGAFAEGFRAVVLTRKAAAFPGRDLVRFAVVINASNSWVLVRRALDYSARRMRKRTFVQCNNEILSSLAERLESRLSQLRRAWCHVRYPLPATPQSFGGTFATA